MQNHADLHDAIGRSVRSALAGHPLVEDAVQEAHIEAWRHSDLPLGHALVRARTRALQVARGDQQLGAPERTPGSGSRRPSLTSYEAMTAEAAEPVTEPVRAAESAVFVDQILDVLEPEERTIAEMMMDGYVHQDIASHFDRSVGWVRARMPRMREKLMPYLGDLRAA